VPHSCLFMPVESCVLCKACANLLLGSGDATEAAAVTPADALDAAA
jgi:hypothetical protein